MSADRSRDALARFHEFLGEKGLMAPATAQARKASSLKLLSILDDEEAADVTKIDIESLVTRFANLHGQEYNPESIIAYRSRLKSAIADFATYLENPLTFKTRSSPREFSSKARKEQIDSSRKSNGQEPQKQASTQTSASANVMASSNVMPIPIRADLTVLIHGLPHDLSLSEAKKISAVISAFAISE